MKRIVGFAFFVMLVILGGYFFLNSSQSSGNLSSTKKQEALKKLLGRDPILNPTNTPSGNNEFKGKYISFFYPKRAVVYTYRPEGRASDAAMLEDFSYDIKTPRIIFNFSVIKIGSTTTLPDYPGVQIRQNQKGTYVQTEEAIDGVKGLVFTKNDISDPEKTGFFLKESKLYSFSFTGNSFDDIVELFGLTVNSAKLTKN